MNVLKKLALVLPLTLITSLGCLGEPEIDERWTLMELVAVNPEPGTSAQANQSLDIAVDARITYRAIITGVLVAELRYSDVVSPGAVALDPMEHTLEIAQDIDQILANSITAGRATRSVTGWDHLMQDFQFTFTAQVPDSATGRGLYLLLYMGDGDEIELPGGEDSLVVTPFVSTDREVLHTGFALPITLPGGGP